MNTKKIAFFLQNLSGGGAEKSVVNLSNYLVNIGIEIDIVLVDKSSAAYLEELDFKIRVVDLNKKRSIKSIFAVKKYIRNSKPDVIMSSVTHINIILSFVALISSKNNTKIVINQVNHLSSIIGHITKNTIFKKLIIKSIIFVYNFSDASISMSKGVEKDLISNGLKINSKYIYNPIVTDQLIKKNIINIKKEQEKTFIAIGRMVPQKNFTLLIDAFYLVNNEIESKLIILGDGPLRADLVNQIADLGLTNKVFLEGFVNNPFDYIKDSDVFVLTSLWEGFGNVVVESLAMGIQVVSTDCNSGPNEILENGKYGFLSKTFHKFELAKLMIKAINKPIDQRLLIERARIFSVKNSADEYKEFLLNN